MRVHKKTHLEFGTAGASRRNEFRTVVGRGGAGRIGLFTDRTDPLGELLFLCTN